MCAYSWAGRGGAGGRPIPAAARPGCEGAAAGGSACSGDGARCAASRLDGFGEAELILGSAKR